MLKKGIVLKDKDEENRGLYLVYIPELMANMDTDKGMWCRNGISNCRLSSSDKGIYGQYQPLYPGTKVEVEVSDSDKTIGIIKNVISDALKDSLPLNYDTENRDEITQVFRTPNNLFIICEDTVEGTEKPLDKNRPQSVHIYMGNGQYKFVLDKDGMHQYLDNHLYATINKDSEIKIPKLTFEGHLIVNGNCDLNGKVYIKETLKVRGETKIANKLHSKDFFCDNISANSSSCVDVWGNDLIWFSTGGMMDLIAANLVPIVESVTLAAQGALAPFVGGIDGPPGLLTAVAPVAHVGFMMTLVSKAQKAAKFFTKIANAIDYITDTVGNVIDTVEEYVEVAIEVASGEITKAFDSLGNSLGVGTSLFDTVGNLVSTVTQTVDTITGTINEVTTAISHVEDQISDTISQVTEIVNTIVDGVHDVTNIIKKVEDAENIITRKISNAVDRVTGDITHKIFELYDGSFVQKAQTEYTKLVNGVGDITNKVVTTISNVENVSDTFNRLYDDITASIDYTIGNATSAIQEVRDEYGNLIRNTTRDIDFISRKVTNIDDILYNVVGDVLEHTKTSFTNTTNNLYHTMTYFDKSIDFLTGQIIRNVERTGNIIGTNTPPNIFTKIIESNVLNNGNINRITTLRSDSGRLISMNDDIVTGATFVSDGNGNFNISGGTTISRIATTTVLNYDFLGNITGSTETTLDSDGDLVKRVININDILTNDIISMTSEEYYKDSITKKISLTKKSVSTFNNSNVLTQLVETIYSIDNSIASVDQNGISGITINKKPTPIETITTTYTPQSNQGTVTETIGGEVITGVKSTTPSIRVIRKGIIQQTNIAKNVIYNTTNVIRNSLNQIIGNTITITDISYITGTTTPKNLVIGTIVNNINPITTFVTNSVENTFNAFGNTISTITTTYDSTGNILTKNEKNFDNSGNLIDNNSTTTTNSYDINGKLSKSVLLTKDKDNNKLQSVTNILDSITGNVVNKTTQSYKDPFGDIHPLIQSEETSNYDLNSGDLLSTFKKTFNNDGDIIRRQQTDMKYNTPVITNSSGQSKFAYFNKSPDKKELDFSFETNDNYGITKIVKDGLKK